MKQYRVLKVYPAHESELPAAIEDALNEAAKEGWVLVSSQALQNPHFTSPVQAILILGMPWPP